MIARNEKHVACRHKLLKRLDISLIAFFTHFVHLLVVIGTNHVVTIGLIPAEENIVELFLLYLHLLDESIKH